MTEPACSYDSGLSWDGNSARGLPTLTTNEEYAALSVSSSVWVAKDAAGVSCGDELEKLAVLGGERWSPGDSTFV